MNIVSDMKYLNNTETTSTFASETEAIEALRGNINPPKTIFVDNREYYLSQTIYSKEGIDYGYSPDLYPPLEDPVEISYRKKTENRLYLNTMIPGIYIYSKYIAKKPWYQGNRQIFDTIKVDVFIMQRNLLHYAKQKAKLQQMFTRISSDYEVTRNDTTFSVRKWNNSGYEDIVINVDFWFVVEVWKDEYFQAFRKNN